MTDEKKPKLITLEVPDELPPEMRSHIDDFLESMIASDAPSAGYFGNPPTDFTPDNRKIEEAIFDQPDQSLALKVIADSFTPDNEVSDGDRVVVGVDYGFTPDNGHHACLVKYRPDGSVRVIDIPHGLAMKHGNEVIEFKEAILLDEEGGIDLSDYEEDRQRSNNIVDRKKLHHFQFGGKSRGIVNREPFSNVWRDGNQPTFDESGKEISPLEMAAEQLKKVNYTEMTKQAVSVAFETAPDLLPEGQEVEFIPDFDISQYEVSGGVTDMTREQRLKDFFDPGDFVEDPITCVEPPDRKVIERALDWYEKAFGVGKKIIAILLILMIPSKALAQSKCYVEKEAPAHPDCVVVSFQMERGVWFSLKKADVLMRVYKMRPLYENQIANLIEAEKQQRLAADDYKKAVGEAKAALDAALVARKTTQEALDEAIKESQSWTNSPTLWFGVGVVSTIAGVILVGVATK